MKAIDLMIGDWVSHRDIDGNVFNHQVIEIRQSDVIVEVPAGNVPTIPLGKIEPIPLTPEILKKNWWRYEFDKKKYMVRYDLKNECKDCWMMWSIDEKTLDLQRQDANLRNIYNLCVQHVVIPCNYIHELQHALRLCGIDKEIVL